VRRDDPQDLADERVNHGPDARESDASGTARVSAEETGIGIEPGVAAGEASPRRTRSFCFSALYGSLRSRPHPHDGFVLGPQTHDRLQGSEERGGGSFPLSAWLKRWTIPA
jgi:hypothetical protein